MKRTLLAGVCILTLVFAGPACAQISAQTGRDYTVKHYGYTATDKFTECARHAFGKNVAYSYRLTRFGAELADRPCPGDRTSLQSFLQERQIVAFETPDWVFLSRLVAEPGDPDFVLQQRSSTQKWKRIKIVTDIQLVKPAKEDGTLEISQEQASMAVQEGLLHARIPPLVEPESSTNGDEGVIRLKIEVTKARLGAGDPEAVISVVHQVESLSEEARMIYGEMRDGKYRVIWDSPLFKFGAIGFRDVTGDGSKEVLIDSQTNDVRHTYQALMILDREGHELTRPQGCDPGGINGVACPLEGGPDEDIVFSENESGPQQINVGSEEYKLTDGLYAGPPGKSRRIFAAEENERGVRNVRAGKYSTAVRCFKLATGYDARNAEYINNLAFAEFKLGQYDNSIQHLYETLELDPRRAVAYLNLGDAYLRKDPNSTAVARQLYAEYLELAPDSKAAPEVKKKLDSLPPGSRPSDHGLSYIEAVILEAKGIGKLQEGKFGDALRDFTEIAGHYPYDAPFLYNLGVACYKTGKYEESVAWLKQATNRNLQYAEAYLNLGDAYWELKLYWQAREAYGKYLQLVPDSIRADEVKKKLIALPIP